MDTMNEMESAIYNYISQHDGGVSFIELENNIPGFKGNQYIADPETDILFWEGLSAEGVDALKILLNDRRIKIVTTTHIVYLVDGAILPYPIAKSWRRYKKPHWMPTVLFTDKQEIK